MTDLQKKQCEQIFNTYGKIPQLDMLTEECAELIQAVCKYKRKIKHGTPQEANRAKDSMVGEMADVLIMIQQIKDGLGIADSEVDAFINYKLIRQLERIGAHNDQK